MTIYELRSADEDWQTFTLHDDVDLLSLCDMLKSDVSIYANWPNLQLITVDGGMSGSDIPIFIGSAPLFSNKAKIALANTIGHCGEWLRIGSDLGPYELFHVLAMPTCLRIDNSSIDWFPGKKLARKIIKYNFDMSVCTNYPIFRIPQDPERVFVSDTFIDCTDRAGLRGYGIIPVYSE